jgi:ABC-type transport system substrate-binding protein
MAARPAPRFLGPSDHNNYTRVVYDALVRFSPTGSEVIPHIAEGWESNEGFTEWTVRLRPGAKWSDGAPFTADDIMFWYNDILLNEELTPSVPVWMQNSDGSTVLVEKVSDYAVKWTFDGPILPSCWTWPIKMARTVPSTTWLLYRPITCNSTTPATLMPPNWMPK